jgi:hypothetical protein
LKTYLMKTYLMKTWNIALLMGLAMLASSCGYSSKSTTPPAAGNVPTIAQLVPASATHGGAGFTLTVNGTNYNSNAVVNWNGTAVTTAYVSGNQITATVSAADIASAGTVQVTVTNPGTPGGQYGGGTQAETSTAMTFTIN